MKTDYDYQELIDELKDEVGVGILKKSDVIQVLRADKAEKYGYFPIIDWYYNKETMIIELSEDSSDTKEEIKEKAMIKKQYIEDQPILKEMTVEACLSEMFEKVNK